MSKPTAPCGHPGEHVIGAYVRCLQGCIKDPHTQPQAKAVKRRAQPGHVDFCGCKPCTMRRRARTVVMRTKDGKEASITWDGATDHVEWTSTLSGSVRHWKILDEDGDVVDDGMCDEKIEVGDIIDLDFFTPTAKLQVKKNPAKRYWKIEYQKLEVPRHYGKSNSWADALEYQYQQVAGYYGLPTERFLPEYGWTDPRGQKERTKNLRQAAKSYNFGSPPLYGRYRTTRDDITAIVHSVPDVIAADLVSHVHGELTVTLRETACTSPDAERALARRVEGVLRDSAPAGVRCYVRLDTVMTRVQESLGRYTRDLMNRWDIGALALQIQRDLPDVLKGFHGVKVVSMATPTGIETDVSYTGSDNQRRHLRHHMRY